jgi:hypothetical protein
VTQNAFFNEDTIQEEPEEDITPALTHSPKMKKTTSHKVDQASPLQALPTL